MICKNADAHKKQLESLSLDDKVQILNKNADAHKMKRESLSPKDKDLFANNHTGAQHKYCKSLSPDQNAEVIKIDAAAHKKHGSLSLLNIKVKLSQLMRLRTKNNMSCFAQRKKQDSWKSGLNNVMNI
jgi:hypothetical protein